MIASSALTSPNARELVAIASFALFIFGLSNLTGPRTAVRGNRLAATGMAFAIMATLLLPSLANVWLIVLGVVVGAIVAAPAARLVKMTQMPQMVALFNGVGGGAVALIAWVEYRSSGGFETVATNVAVFSLFAAIIGSISFWGSLVAFGKLQELLPGRPLTLGRPQTLLNGALALTAVACAAAIVGGSRSELLIVALLVAAGVLGVLAVLPIGGADMPVVISILNALTGLSAAATGVALNNTSLIVGGMLVGASGSILTRQMAEAMNRSIVSIVAGGFGGTTVAAGAAGAAGTVRSTSPSDVAIQLAYASTVVIVPGYGMAASQAQYAMREMTKLLEANGVDVKYAIHPVAGRMPGHMNVLLAEADVPYEQLVEMRDINPEFPRTDVAVLIGANDVVNPDARSNPQSPLYGMPILDVDGARSIIVLKRSLRSGYAGVDNPLFSDPKTSMLFGDAKESLAAVTAELKELVAAPAARG
jgi:H+-translocating NAD(P) transhydrogenase subunit beta